MGKFLFSGVAAALIGGAALLSGAAPLSAATLPSLAVAVPGDTALVEQVARRERLSGGGGGGGLSRRGGGGGGLSRHGGTGDGIRLSRRGGERRYSSYDRNRHGWRYKHSKHGHRHHHYDDDYYYLPWWIGPSIGFGLSADGYGYGYDYGQVYGGGHVEWCLNRYRSYDPTSDTYLGYDGYRHRCNSPYL